MSKLKLAAVAVAVLTQTACGTAGPAEEGAPTEEGLAQAESGLEVRFVTCTQVEPDAVLWIGNGYNIPLDSLPHTTTSGSGEYYYQGCGRYVVDIHIGNTAPPSQTYPYALDFAGAAHDLPSSATVGGERPNNSIDCAAFRLHQTFYRKNASDTWDTLGASSQKGVWNYSTGKCDLQVYSGAMTQLINVQNPDNVGDVYRVAVSVKLRSSGQEAKVTVGSELVIPPPK